MKPSERKVFRCAIYTRKSTEHNLDLEFNSLDAQREACEAYIKSQAHEGWRLVPDRYDDGGLSGASLERPALQALLADVRAGKINTVVVYKVDRLTRSLADFAKLVELFDQYEVSFVSITQSFNTTSSMGRLTLNVLLSFAQFEREVIGERVRDKIAASKRKGIWVGGPVPLGYRVIDKKLVVVPEEAEAVRTIFTSYLQLGSIGAPRYRLSLHVVHARAQAGLAGDDRDEAILLGREANREPPATGSRQHGSTRCPSSYRAAIYPSTKHWIAWAEIFLAPNGQVKSVRRAAG
jgi:site-specific DNA recombinase